MRCGKCKTEGVDINHVKSCYGIKPETPFKDWGLNPKFTDGGLEKVEEDEPFWPPSDAQVGYALTLQEERLLPDNWESFTDATLRLKNKDEVSSLITMLKAFPRKDKGDDKPEWTMPAGRYCVEVEDGGKSELYFVQIDKPEQGRWKGYTFAKRLIGAPGDYAKVNMSVPMRKHVMRLIENDPKGAMIRYGQETSVCGRCNSPLTDPLSRELGIGPKCRTMSGWW